MLNYIIKLPLLLYAIIIFFYLNQMRFLQQVKINLDVMLLSMIIHRLIYAIHTRRKNLFFSKFMKCGLFSETVPEVKCAKLHYSLSFWVFYIIQGFSLESMILNQNALSLNNVSSFLFLLYSLLYNLEFNYIITRQW